MGRVDGRKGESRDKDRDRERCSQSLNCTHDCDVHTDYSMNS